MQIFVWIMLQNKVLTANNLKKRGSQLLEMCYMCRHGDDTVEHHFNYCSFFSSVVRMLLVRMEMRQSTDSPSTNWYGAKYSDKQGGGSENDRINRDFVFCVLARKVKSYITGMITKVTIEKYIFHQNICILDHKNNLKYSTFFN